MSSRALGLLAAAGAAVFLAAPKAEAATITEGSVDEPDRPLTTDLVGAVRGSDLTSIRGSLSSPTDVDLYSFILLPRSFSASTAANFDTQLFLFDSSGRGVCSNDDRAGGRITSSLTAGACGIAPNEAGLYHLAVSAYNVDPVSRSGLIFPDPPFNPNGSLGTFGPTGPGGGALLSGWTGPVTSGGSYTISLSGAGSFNSGTTGGGAGDTGGGTGGSTGSSLTPGEFGSFPPLCTPETEPSVTCRGQFDVSIP